MSEACSVFGHRQVFTGKFCMNCDVIKISITVVVFYCSFKIFAANLKRPKVANPIRLNQGKPFCIAIDRDLGLTEFLRKKKQKRDREKHLKQ